MYGGGEFKTHVLNRVVNLKHVADIENGAIRDFDAMPPLVVSRASSVIIDGQHRYEAYKNLYRKGVLSSTDEIYIQYVDDLTSDEEFEMIKRANAKTKNWSLDDYIRAYIDNDEKNLAKYNKGEYYPNYLNLARFAEEHPLTNDELSKEVNPKSKRKKTLKFRLAMRLINGSYNDAETKRGMFKCTDEAISTAYIYREEIYSMLNTLKWQVKGNSIEDLATAWYKIRKDYDISDFGSFLNGMVSMNKDIANLPRNNKKDFTNLFKLVIGSLGIGKKHQTAE